MFSSTVLYRCPGPHSRAGGTWDYLGVTTEEDHKAAIAAGWHPSMLEAIDAYEGKKAAVMAEVEKEVEAEVTVEVVGAEPVVDVVEEAPVVPVRNKPGPKPKPKV